MRAIDIPGACAGKTMSLLSELGTLNIILRLWRDGKHQEVKDYLLNDLKMTEAIFMHGKKVGKFRYEHKDYGKSLGEREVKVKW